MRLSKHFLTLALAFAAVAASAPSRADDTTGKATTIKVVTVVGNPHRPAVTVVLAKQKMNLPLHEMKHPLDTTPAASPL